ncbi:MAG: YeeE/YedE family protein, partial [Muriicola sp.]|nr:YeeE/YedE family protein [Muriicola sp.]NNK34836.1 YeeE/YedE family protein [Eudoraea sp.]
LYDWSSALTLKGSLILIGGGILVGFGTRYAGGCTSGHAITGLSNLQWPSLVAVIGFFIGGLIMVHFLYPLIFTA